MKKEIVNKKDGIVRITTYDERWYARTTNNKETGLPEYQFVPSVTWIADFYPKTIAFYKWLANKGWDEAESIKATAGDKGSKIHYAICDLIDGKEVKMDDKYINHTTGQLEELSVEEYEAILAFANWFKAIKPKVKSRETTVFNDKEGYAGTIDLLCEIEGQEWLIDFKTGQNIWPSYEMQVSAYRRALSEWQGIRMAILQVGYKRNKNAYKFTEVADKYELFLAGKKIWANECEGQSPKQRDYPMSVSLKEIKVVVKKAKK